MKRFLLLIILIFSLSFGVYAVEFQSGKFFYTVQVASFKEKSKALEILNRLKDLPYARVSYRNGRFKVRVGFFSSFAEAEKFVKEKLEGRVGDFYITKIRFIPEGIIYASEVKRKEKIERKKEKEAVDLPVSSGEMAEREKGVEFQKRKKVEDKEVPPGNTLSNTAPLAVEKEPLEREKSTSPAFQEFPSQGKSERKKNKEKRGESVAKGKTVERTVSVQKERGSLGKLTAIPFLMFVLLVVFSFTLFLRRKGRVPADRLEVFISKLLNEGKCEELLETVLPLLTLQPENTFLRKAVADCYLNLGKFLEAASFYEEIAEILERKGLKVLSEEFKNKAEEIYEREFKGRG